jgi:hypothetical protein
MKYNPNGMVIMNARAPGRAWITDHTHQANYLTHTLLDQNRETGDLQHATGMPYAVSRLYPFEPHANTHDRDQIREYAKARYQDLQSLRADAMNHNVLFQINNEQGFRHDDFLMYKYMIEEAAKDPSGPVGMVFWNGASGAVKTGHWGQENQWEGGSQIEFLETFHHHRNLRLPNGSYALILGVHSYTSQYPLIAVNGGEWRLDSEKFNDAGFQNLWDSHNAFLDGELTIDWRLPQDHMARNFQGINKALGWIPTEDGQGWEPGPNIHRDINGDPIECPWILNTEQGFDSMNDVRHVHWDDLVLMSDPALEDWEQKSIDYALSLGLPEHTLSIPRPAGGIQSQIMLDTPRGYRSLEKTWQKPNWFPGASLGDAFAYCMDWKHRVIYNKTGYHIGGHVYSLGDTSGPNFWWVSFNLWDTGEGRPPQHDYFEAMTRPELQVEIVPHFLGPVNEESPSMAGTWEQAVLSRNTEVVGNTRVNIREESNGEVIGVLDQPILVEVFVPEDVRTDIFWWNFRNDAFDSAYVRSDVVVVDFDVSPEEPIPDLSDYVRKDEIDTYIREFLRSI